MSADPIRARLDWLWEASYGTIRADTARDVPPLDGVLETFRDALRAVLDLCDDHALCPALANCERDPSSCSEADIRTAIAEALGVQLQPEVGAELETEPR